jgi:hypothetical protein
VAVAGPIVLLGVAGLAVRARGRGNGVGLWAVALTGVLGLAAALASGRVVVGSAETAVGESAPAHAWAGPLVDLWWASLLVGLLAGSRVLLPRRHGGPAGRRALVWVLVAVAVAPVLVGAAGWAVAGVGDRLSPARDRVPAVAVEQARGPLATRLLHLAPTADVVDFRLVSAEPGPLARGLDRAPDVDDSDLLRTVGELVAGPDAAGPPLARLGIGFVQVDDVATSDLVRRLDAAPGLSRLGTGEAGILWRVQPLAVAAGAVGAPAPSRVRLADPDGRLLRAVPVSGPHAAVDTVVPPSAGPRLLVMAEPLEWTRSARVTLDGVPLTRTGAAQPTYLVPGDGGRLSVDLDSADPHWRTVQLGVLAFLVFMAVPLGSRRSRRGA